MFISEGDQIINLDQVYQITRDDRAITYHLTGAYPNAAGEISSTIAVEYPSNEIRDAAYREIKQQMHNLKGLIDYDMLIQRS